MIAFNKISLFLVLFPLVGTGDTSTHELCSNMLADFKACFAGELTPERLVNEWKWGDIKLTSVFDFAAVENPRSGLIFATCPFGTDMGTKGTFSLLNDYPKVHDIWFGDRPYLTFGIQYNHISKKHFLTFVNCSKKSDMYPYVHSVLKLSEPSSGDVRTRLPFQYWDTTVHDKQSFQYSRIDDQFVLWDVLASAIDVVYRFNQQECIGVMLVARDSASVVARNSEKRNHQKGTFDLSKFTENFRWIPDHQIEHFAREEVNHLAEDKPYHSVYDFSRTFAQFFKSKMGQCESNNEFVQRLGFRHLGIVRTPVDYILDVPWADFSYYKSIDDIVILRSREAEGVGEFHLELFDSFVLNVEEIADGVQALLPNALEIKPYLHKYPATGVLYEHIRADQRSRIIVQPYIAYLYEDSKLVKILVCSDKNGPADHGWCLQRSFYANEILKGYYWPVSRAYSPLED